MRKLIETSQEKIVVCDNPNCDYEVLNNEEHNEKLIHYVGLPCPKCGQELLTLDDYIISIKLDKYVNWVNKWFSWLTIFQKPIKRQCVTAHIHNKKIELS